MRKIFEVSPIPNHRMAGMMHATGGTKRKNCT
jgi:hypothetical protein